MDASKSFSGVTDFRAGSYVRQPTGYRAFIPASLPPDPSVRVLGEMADVFLARNY